MHDKLIVRIFVYNSTRYRRFEPIDCTVRTYGTVLPGDRLNLNGCIVAWREAFFLIFFLDSSSTQPTEHSTGWRYLDLAWIHVGKYANMNASQIQVKIVLPEPL